LRQRRRAAVLGILSSLGARAAPVAPLYYLCRTLGQWDILFLNFTSIGFTFFLDVSSLIFPFLQMLMLQQ
jgi:hypothetical protein